MIIHKREPRKAKKGLHWVKEDRFSLSQLDFPKATSPESQSHRGAAWLGQMWVSSKSQPLARCGGSNWLHLSVVTAAAALCPLRGVGGVASWAF